MYTLSGNIGLPLGETGFLNLTGEYGNALPHRPQRHSATTRSRSSTCRGTGMSVRDPAQIWGSPDRCPRRDQAVGQHRLRLRGPDAVLRSHGNYVQQARSRAASTSGTRTPGAACSAPANDDGERILLVGDLLDAAGRRARTARRAAPRCGRLRRWRGDSTRPRGRNVHGTTPTAGPSRRCSPAGSHRSSGLERAGRLRGRGPQGYASERL